MLKKREEYRVDEKKNVVGRTRSFLVSHLLHSREPLPDPPPHSPSPPRLMRLVEDDLTAVCAHVCVGVHVCEQES